MEPSQASHPAAAESAWWVPLVLAFVAAFVDAVTFLGLFSTFVAFITGTIIVLATEIANPESRSTLKLVTIGTFLVGIFLWMTIIKALFHHHALAGYLLTVQALLLALMVVLARVFEPVAAAGDPATMLLAMTGALAMSLQNALMAIVLHLHPPTTVMTGNLTKLAARVVEPTAGADAHPQRAGQTQSSWWIGLATSVGIIAAFVLGALAGAAGFLHWGFAVLALPALLLAGTAAAAFAKARAPV